VPFQLVVAILSAMSWIGDALAASATCKFRPIGASG
jgi:hypothetical protein